MDTTSVSFAEERSIFQGFTDINLVNYLENIITGECDSNLLQKLKHNFKKTGLTH